MNITLSLYNGSFARIKTDEGFAFVEELVALMSPCSKTYEGAEHAAERLTVRHFVGQDGSDIYLRPADIVMIAVDA